MVTDPFCESVSICDVVLRYWPIHLALGFVILVVVYLVLNYAYHLYLYRTQKRPETTLLSGDSVPDRIQTIIDTLLSTGFVQVNTVKMKYPFRRAMISWLLISNDGEIFVWVSHKAMRPWAEFFSYYPDASAVITRYPLGGTVESPMLVSRFAAKSFENALTHHRQTLVTWEGIRGRPLQMRDFTDVQATEDHYYKYHQRQDIQYIVRVTTLTLIFLLVFITLLMSSVFAILTRQPYEVMITVIEVTSAGIVLSITGFVIVYLSLTRQQRAVDS